MTDSYLKPSPEELKSSVETGIQIVGSNEQFEALYEEISKRVSGNPALKEYLNSGKTLVDATVAALDRINLPTNILQKKNELAEAIVNQGWLDVSS